VSTDVVMTLIAAIILASFLRYQSANRGHVVTAWVLGLYCGSITWIGPNVRQFFAWGLALLASHLSR
jgi:hypothetical protein